MPIPIRAPTKAPSTPRKNNVFVDGSSLATAAATGLGTGRGTAGCEMLGAAEAEACGRLITRRGLGGSAASAGAAMAAATGSARGVARAGALGGGALPTEPIGESGAEIEAGAECAMIQFALSVPERPHTGQFTSHGIRPFT